MTTQPDSLRRYRIAILGLGLMGGSLALALRDQCKTLLGVDRDPKTISLAHRRQIVERISSDPQEILAEADALILATPVKAIIDLIERLPDLVPATNPGIIVLDLGSTKTQICQAFESLPERFDPLGGHPMCGKETSGLVNAEADLYRGAPFAFTPLRRTTDRARAFAAQLTQAVGARDIWLDPITHDRWAASTSHLPYLVSTALVAATPQEVSPLIGPGFRDASRLAESPADIMLDILATNREHILPSLKRFRHRVEEIENELSSGNFEALKDRLEESASRRVELVSQPVSG